MSEKSTVDRCLALSRVQQLQAAISKQLERTMQARDLPRAVALSERTAKEVKEVKESWDKCNGALRSVDFSATVATGRKALRDCSLAPSRGPPCSRIGNVVK